MNKQDIAAQSEQQAQTFVRKNAEILEMIATGQSASDIYNAIALMYEARHQGLRCSLLELKGDTLKHGGAPSLPNEYCDAVNGLQIGPNVGSCGTSTYTGKRVLVENIETDPKWAEIKQAALPHGMRCCWSEPIKGSDGKILGAFGMYRDHPALPNEDEVADLQSAARLAGIIMERDQREIALRQSEKKYRRLSENSPAIVFQFKMASDGGFSFPHINSAVKSIMGITAEEIMQDSSGLLGMVHPDDQEIFFEDIHKSAECLAPYHAVIRFLKNKEERWLEARSTPDSMEDGSILWDGFFLDITDRIKAEETIQNAEERFRGIVESMADWIWEIDSEGRYTYCSKKVESILGYTPGEMIGKTPFDFMVPNQAEKIDYIFNKIITEKRPIKNLLNWCFSKDGRKVCLVTNGVPILDKNENLLGFRGVDSDITDKIKSENALKESEEKYRNLIETMPNGFYLSNTEGYFLEANPAFVRMLGYDSLDELKKVYIPSDIYVHEKERETAQKNAEFINRVESYRLKRKDGKIIWVEDNARYIKNNEGIVIYNQGICRDVTDKKQAEDVNKTLFAISNAVNLTSNLDDLYKRIHTLLGQVIDVTNFFIAIVNEKKHTLYFPYYVDTVDDDFSPLKNFDPKDSLTGFVVSNRKPLLLRKEQLQALSEKNGVWGPVPLIWMGVPLIIKGEIIGVIVLQSYTDPDMYSNDDLRILISISDQMAIAIDRKRTEDILKESEKKYRYLFENGSDLLCLHDLNGNFLDTNLQHKEEYGWQDYNIIGKNIKDLIPEQYKSEFDQYLDRITKTGKDDGYLKGYTGSGEIIMMEYRNKLVLNADGTPEAVLGTARDITDRWKAEKKLENSEKRYRTLFEKAEDAIFILDASTKNMGQIIDANQSAAAMHGYSLDEIKKLNIKDLDAPSDAEKVDERILSIIEGKWIKNELNHIRKDGSLFPVEMSAGLIDIGKSKFVLAIDRDIEERKEFETKLRNSEKMNAIGNLAGGIAHDFNNILSAILGYTELALLKAENKSIIEQYLHHVLKAGGRAKDLVKQILTVARQTDKVMVPLSVASITNEALKLMRSSLPSTIEIKQEIKSDSLITGDPSQIHQIIMNLCTNAFHAMEEKGGYLKVSVSNAVLSTNNKNKIFNLKQGDYIELVVSDNGVGIPDDTVKSIFEPYYTTKKPGEGIGLGLAIVHGIVKAHGGEILVDTSLGKGTKFTVYFPILQTTKRQLSNKKEALPTGNEHVLFVDDEKTIVEIYEKFLEKLGYTVSAQTSSSEALKIFKTEPDKFDIVITDMTMPKMTGDVLFAELRAIKPDIPIIICTGYSKKMSNEVASKLGINAICYKPLSMKDLAKEIRKILDL